MMKRRVWIVDLIGLNLEVSVLLLVRPQATLTKLLMLSLIIYHESMLLNVLE